MWEAVAAQRTAGRRGEVVAAAAETAGEPGEEEEEEEEAAEEEGTTERRERVRDMAAWRSQSSGPMPTRPRAVIGLVRGGSMDSPEDDRQC